MSIDINKTKDIVRKYPKKDSSLIPILQDINAEYNYLPCDALKLIGDELGVPLSKIFSVSTFYKAFSLKPKGKKIIKVCMGTACHIRGAPLLVDELEKELNIKAGETTEDLEFTIEAVNCVGACAMAPVIVVNEQYYGNVKPDEVKKILTARNEDES